MLAWMLATLAISFISFKIGAAYGEVKTYEENLQLLYEAKQALINAREYLARARALVEVFDEATTEEGTVQN